MPNYIENVILFRFEEPKKSEIKDFLGDSPINFQSIIEQPPKTSGDWRTENWGVQSNASNPIVVFESQTNYCIRFVTTWGVPTHIIERILDFCESKNIDMIYWGACEFGNIIKYIAFENGGLCDSSPEKALYSLINNIIA